MDEEGSSRGLILSLLFDHCLLLHPEQIARIESKLSPCTVGSLQRKSQMDVLLAFIKTLLDQPAAATRMKELAELIDDTFQLMPSSKHMVGKNLGRLESTSSLNPHALGSFLECQVLKTGRSSIYSLSVGNNLSHCF